MSSVNWTINDLSFGAWGISGVELTTVNQSADTLSFTHDGVLFDGDLIFDHGTELTLKRNGVVWFRGKVRETPRDGSAAGERIGYTARGAWDVLERKNYLQNFAAPADPDDPESAIIQVKRGRVVLGQDDAGLKVTLTAFLSQVISYAGFTPAVYLGTMKVPFDEVTDYKCADVISRLLQWAPDAVVWPDYSTTPTTIHIQPRSLLPAHTLDLAGGEIGADGIRINPRNDLVADHVAIFYIFTNRANTASWEETVADVYPPGTTGEEDGALVRTIRLAGSIANSSFLVQPVKTRFITEGLDFPSSTIKAGEEGFDNIANFWKRRLPWLAKAGVVIQGFRKGTRTNDADEAFDTVCERELTEGAITEWMQKAPFNVVAEAQKFTAEVAVDVPVQDGTKERQYHALSARLLATDAQTRSYSLQESGDYTPAEERPEGLAETLHGIVSVLHWDVSIQIQEEECTARPGLGYVYNLANGRPEWATMNALVQSRRVNIDAGQTLITAGPPKHLGADTAVEIFRNNRNREPVTSYMVRTTGRTGGAGGSGQGLGQFAPINEASSNPLPPSFFTGAITTETRIPTKEEAIDAIIAVYGEVELDPKSGDQVRLTKGGRVILCYTISLNGSHEGGGTLYDTSFVIGAITYYIKGWQVGLF